MIEIIPAIDVIDGKCVRLTKGDYKTAKVYNGNPLDVAKTYADAGCKKLHLVDLDGAKSSHIVNCRVLEQIASSTSLVVDFGGGIKQDEDIRKAFDYGASKVTLGSIAVTGFEQSVQWLDHYGHERIIIGADTRDGKISTSGWLVDSDRNIIDFIKEYTDCGATQVISTDINLDGTLKGPSIPLYRDILCRFPDLWLIASGGVGSMDDIYALHDAGLPAVIVGKAIYEGRVTIKQLENFNLE